jgi:hypothetical protein
MFEFNCVVTEKTGRTFPALYKGGAVYAPRLSDGVIAKDMVFEVEGRPSMPFKRALTDHGTYAARVGGPLVTVRPIEASELAEANRKISGWLA